MKQKITQAILFMALVGGINQEMKAQSYGEDINQNDGVAFRANNDSSNHAEYFRFYTGRGNETNGTGYLAELGDYALILNGREASQGTNVKFPVGNHYSILSNRGLHIHADINNTNNKGETILFSIGRSTTVEVDDEVMKVKKLSAFTNASLPIRIGNTDIVDFSEQEINFKRKLIFNTDGNNRIGVGISNPATSIHVKGGNMRVDSGEFQSHGPIVLHPDVDGSGDDKIEFRNSSNEEVVSIQNGSIDLLIRGSNGGGEIRSNGALKFKPEADATGNDDKISFYNGENREMTRIQDGVITTHDIVLNVNSFPDYVFEKEYELMPLKEVSKYIETNKHLPNMPSEKEVIANGMQIAKVNRVLVEKVEELTLYTIQQQLEIEAQNKRIESLLEKIELILENK